MPNTEFEEVVGSSLLEKDFTKNMNNQVNSTDVTLMSLALIDFGEFFNFLRNHDFIVAGGLFAAGVILVYLYHKYGSK